MLLRVYVQSKDEFDRWIQQQPQPALVNDAISHGQRIFETTACINCYTVSGTEANGRFGPNLRTGESVAIDSAGVLWGLFLRRANAQPRFNDVIRRMLCDHNPMLRRE
jgi:hypothetical protein